MSPADFSYIETEGDKPARVVEVEKGHVEIYVDSPQVGVIETTATEVGMSEDIRLAIGEAVDSAIANNPTSGVTNQVLSDAIETHSVSPAPHPVYDDLPSLSLIFKNGLL